MLQVDHRGLRNRDSAPRFSLNAQLLLRCVFLTEVSSGACRRNPQVTVKTYIASLAGSLRIHIAGRYTRSNNALLIRRYRGGLRDLHGHLGDRLMVLDVRLHIRRWIESGAVVLEGHVAGGVNAIHAWGASQTARWDAIVADGLVIAQWSFSWHS